MTKREQDYVFEELSPDFLREHARKLSRFRYIRGYGGHVDNADRLEACFLYSDEADLVRKLTAIGIPCRRHEIMPPQPIPGVPYHGDEFPSLIEGTKWIEQPRWCFINGEKIFVWCHLNEMSISVNEIQLVLPEDFSKAQRLEAHLAPLNLSYLDPPQDNWHCVCPQHHPDIFA